LFHWHRNVLYAFHRVRYFDAFNLVKRHSNFLNLDHWIWHFYTTNLFYWDTNMLYFFHRVRYFDAFDLIIWHLDFLPLNHWIWNLDTLDDFTGYWDFHHSLDLIRTFNTFNHVIGYRHLFHTFDRIWHRHTLDMLLNVLDRDWDILYSAHMDRDWDVFNGTWHWHWVFNTPMIAAPSWVWARANPIWICAEWTEAEELLQGFHVVRRSHTGAELIPF